jgi:lipopolysaccharide transport system ATP-binding protein
MEVISAQNLSKRYTIGGVHHTSIRDAIGALFRGGGNGGSNEVLALDDVSFSVAEGERVGIIGANGSGKSTLLKILSRITKPSKGSAVIHGRVGSLLEVGTGFHAELSGRENIYLNGAILGMKRVEIDRKLDEMVAFSEIDRFLDTPVKYYSSGMYMRLAFSIAAHLEPDILIVDEVLAVGDAAFQRRCLSKMREVGESGRTVLFVSHDMAAVMRLCGRAIWLNKGELAFDGPSERSVGEYLHHQSQTGADRTWQDGEPSPGDDIVRLRRVRVCDQSGKSVSSVDVADAFFVEMSYEVVSEGHVLIPNIHFFNPQGDCIFVSHDWYSGWRDQKRSRGMYVSRMQVPPDLLNEGSIFVTAVVTTYRPFHVHFSADDVISFSVVETGGGGLARGDYAGPFPGTVRPVLSWETESAG